jgi:hypothetical protein
MTIYKPLEYSLYWDIIWIIEDINQQLRTATAYVQWTVLFLLAGLVGIIYFIQLGYCIICQHGKAPEYDVNNCTCPRRVSGCPNFRDIEFRSMGTTSLLPQTFVLSLLQTSKSDSNHPGASTSVGSPSVVKTKKNEPPLA